MSKRKTKRKPSKLFYLLIILLIGGGFTIYKLNNNELNNTSEGTITTKESSNNNTSTITTTTTTEKIETTTTKKSTTVSSEVDYSNVEEISGNKEYVGKTSKGYDIYKINGVTYIDGYLIANKTYALPESYYPTNTKADARNRDNTCNDCINIKVYNAFKAMQADAQSLGLSIKITSGYRPYETQEYLYNRYKNRDGKEAADTYSARAGHSEHQSGLCFDLNSITDAFANTSEGKWVNENAYKYGFIIRYPKGKSDETGYKYESWHLRYVGEDLAKTLYNNGDWITMESYFGITSAYVD